MLKEIVERLADYSVVLKPDEDKPEWWAGAPSVIRTADGVFYLACRMREGNSPKGKRGYEIRILRSEDGVSFEKVAGITREAAGVTGFERPALARDPSTGRFKLYCCTGLEKGWAVIRFDDADRPSDFQPETRRVILQAHPTEDDLIEVTGYKDPVVFHYKDEWNMLVIGIDRVERVYRFTSPDGERWKPSPEFPLMENTGWHNLYTRPASVLPMSVGFLFVYEGSHFSWYDPNYNIATGLAYTPDLKQIIDLTPSEPLLVSTTPGKVQTWRYSDWLRVGDEVYVYFEAANPNGTNEIRMARIRATECLLT